MKSLTGLRYGSELAKGTLLTLLPGEYIAASVKFQLEDKYSIDSEDLQEGEWQLSAEWHQMGRGWHVKDCRAWNSYFQYEGFYEQQRPALPIQITAKQQSDESEASSVKRDIKDH